MLLPTNTTDLGLQCKVADMCLNFNKIRTFLTDNHKSLQYQILKTKNLFSKSHANTCTETDGQTDMTKLFSQFM